MNKQMSYYTFLSIFKFCTFKDLSIYQNQLFISDVLRHNTLTLSGNHLINFLSNDLFEILEDAERYGQENDYIPAHKFSAYLDDRDCKLIKVPEEIIFCTEFFRYISNICRGNGHSRIITDNRIYLTLNNAVLILRSDNKYWSLKREVYRYLTNVYLQGEIEEQDWDVLTEIALNQTSSIIKFQSVFKEYVDKDEKVIYVDDHSLFPNA